ncbi:hypothetical protein DBL07_04925 [Achromobacter mucicolens]|uniref:hypothetical protein n=1 Tax=Achromobacter mucicolens TaxID=1389922 RepID=UPI000D3718F6|nr:hypothetical protein [Achromobacter mucicolens]PTX07283.1 hypothetical protein DBL07_04925 [Achromobacter mucicolens]
MYQNNMVYKGYRLTASVSRVSVGNAHRPAFTATVAVELAGDQDRLGEPHAVPLFVAGGFVATPGMAVDAAITHGRLVVDSHSRAG